MHVSVMFRWTVHLEGPNRPYNAAVAVEHKIYSFGGSCTREIYMNNMGQIDVHVFNTLSLRWAKLPAVTTGGRLLEVPSMCFDHTAVLIDHISYIWGGFTYTREYCNVLYTFDVNTHRWFKAKVSGTVPEGRYDHSACVSGEAVYIFGGFNLLNRYTCNDIYKLDSTTMVWSLINTRGTPTSASRCHSATIIGTKMFVFGNYNYDKYSGVRVFDTETNCWQEATSAQLLPGGRGCHSAFVRDGELYIFGGYNFRLDQRFNDLWRFNPDTFSWKEVETKGKGPGGKSSMCCCAVGDRIVLFGGSIHTPNDLYILDLSPSLKTLCKLAVIQYGLERSGLPHDIRWELAAMTTDSSRGNE